MVGLWFLFGIVIGVGVWGSYVCGGIGCLGGCCEGRRVVGLVGSCGGRGVRLREVVCSCF